MKYNKEYREDLIMIVKVIKNLEKLEKCKILITGSSGLICSAIVDFLMILNEIFDYKISVFAAARNIDNLNSRFYKYQQSTMFNSISYDALNSLECDVEFDYIIHGASNSNPTAYLNEPVETMLANFIGINNIFKYSINKKIKRILFISSSEIYGNKNDNFPYIESESYSIDILDSRSCYPSSKRASETLCASYRKEYGIDYVIVRPGHIYGPTMTQNDSRAISYFLRKAIKHEDIILRSIGSQKRSYCYVLDCVSAIIVTLLNGQSGEAYNISNKNSIVSIAEVALYISNISGSRLVYEINDEMSNKNTMKNSVLNSDKLEKLGWYAIFDINVGIEKSIEQF